MSLTDIPSIINGMNIKQRPDGRYEGRLTINGTRKSFYGSTRIEEKREVKTYLQKIENGYHDPQKIE